MVVARIGRRPGDRTERRIRFGITLTTDDRRQATGKGSTVDENTNSSDDHVTDPFLADDAEQWNDPDELDNLCALSPVVASIMRMQSLEMDGDFPDDPREAAADLSAFASNGIIGMGGLDGPCFLWNHMIADIATMDDARRTDSPVAPPEDAARVMDTPIRWYLDACESSPDADAETHTPPVFHMDTQVLAGVDAVVGNALSSTHWLDATRNLALALDTTIDFIGSVNDDNNEVFDYLLHLIQQIRLYMTSVAEHADTITSIQAMAVLVEAACDGPMLLNPVQLMLLVSCGLPFAKWDDTRVIAYDALARVTRAMKELSREADQDPTNPMVITRAGETLTFRDCVTRAQMRFTKAALLLKHDLLRMAGDDDQADAMLLEHPGMAPLADAYAARLLSQDKWDELRRFSALMENDHPDMDPLLFPPDLVPLGWASIQDMALAECGSFDELSARYRRRIIASGPKSDDPHLITVLRSISGPQWPRQVELIVHEFEAEDGCGMRGSRNGLYERILIDNHLCEPAWRYANRHPGAKLTLAPVFARTHPQEARATILGRAGLADDSLQGLSDGTISDGTIIRAMRRYYHAFGKKEARDLAERMLPRSGTRARLCQWLAGFVNSGKD